MHSLDGNASNVPAFLIKLWKLVEDSECNDLISWSEKGNSFLIRNQATFAKELLPQYFKHNNMASFIRQLNMYGFKKIANYEKSGLKVLDFDETEFYHPFFMKDQEALLDLIKRKIPSAKVSEPCGGKASPKDILTDLTTIREKQENMNNLLLGMKKENELLWRELSNLRQKHKTQEQIIQKVIQFLLSIVQTGKQNIGVKRKLHHMIRNSSSSEGDKSHMSRQIDVVRGKSSDFFITVPQEKSSSPLGPVIHEVTDLDHEESVVTENTSKYGQYERLGDSESDAESQGANLASSVASPLDALRLLEPLTSSKSSLLAISDDEHVLGLPVDFPSSSHIGLVDDVASVVTVPADSDDIPVSVDATNLLSIPDNAADVISIPDVVNAITISDDSANVISIPDDAANAICLPDITTPDGSPIVLGSDLVPFTSSVADLGMDISTKSSSGSATNSMRRVNAENGNAESIQYMHSSGVSKPKKKRLSMSSSQNSGKRDCLLSAKMDKSERNNLQLAISDVTSSSENSIATAKNVFSNHVLNVEEELDWLQTQLATGNLHIDSSMLLGLFNSDDTVNNAALASQLTADDRLLPKDTDNNIVGNELVQFTPSMLEMDLCGVEETDLLSCFSQSDDVHEDHLSSDNVLLNMKQEASEDLACPILDSNTFFNVSNSSPKITKSPKGKGRRKVK